MTYNHGGRPLPLPILLTFTLSTFLTWSSEICPVLLPDPPSGPDVTPPQVNNAPDALPRIINGDLVSEKLRPYLVYIFEETSDITIKCSGTLISPSWVLTAAHCAMYSDDALLVYPGIRKAENTPLPSPILVQESIMHPDFSPSDDPIAYAPYDIALLRLSKPAEGKFMRINVNQSSPALEEFVRSIGYGTSRHYCDPTHSEKPREKGLLRQVDVTVFNSTECEEIHKAELGFPKLDYNNLICTGYRERTSICSASFGDSGGPLIRYDNSGPVLVGVTSFGGTCALENIPVAYVRSSRFEDWLDEEGAIYSKAGSSSVPVFTIAPEVTDDPEPSNESELIDDIDSTLQSNSRLYLIAVGSAALLLICVGVFVIIGFINRRRRRAESGQERRQAENSSPDPYLEVNEP